MGDDASENKVSWLNLVCSAYLLYSAVNRLTHGRVGWWAWVCLAFGVYMLGFEAYKWRCRSRAARPFNADDDDDDKPLRSLVFFLESPREIQPGAWVDQIGAALGVNLSSQADDAMEFLLPMPHPTISPEEGDCFMLKVRGAIFWIFNLRKPYMDDPEGFAKTIPDKRLREAVARHEAWISVDLMHASGPVDKDVAYDVIGKVLSTFAGPDVLAVHAPELGRCNEFDPALIERLANGNPLAIFQHPTHAPILNIESTDPEMVAATDKARRRWPEFVDYFQNRQPNSEAPFIVKAPFGKGEHQEFMWVAVESIDDDFVVGKLANQPHHIDDLHEGQEVTVPVDVITDWLCADATGNPVGGWTNAVINHRSWKQQPTDS